MEVGKDFDIYNCKEREKGVNSFIEQILADVFNVNNKLLYKSFPFASISFVFGQSWNVSFGGKVHFMCLYIDIIYSTIKHLTKDTFQTSKFHSIIAMCLIPYTTHTHIH